MAMPTHFTAAWPRSMPENDEKTCVKESPTFVAEEFTSTQQEPENHTLNFNDVMKSNSWPDVLDKKSPDEKVQELVQEGPFRKSVSSKSSSTEIIKECGQDVVVGTKNSYLGVATYGAGGGGGSGTPAQSKAVNYLRERGDMITEMIDAAACRDKYIDTNPRSLKINFIPSNDLTDIDLVAGIKNLSNYVKSIEVNTSWTNFCKTITIVFAQPQYENQLIEFSNTLKALGTLVKNITIGYRSTDGEFDIDLTECCNIADHKYAVTYYQDHCVQHTVTFLANINPEFNRYPKLR